MAELGTAVTLQDLSRKLGPDNKIAKVIEVIQKKNAIIDDIVWVEGNLPTGHVTTIRNGYPEPTWRKLNYGVQAKKSTTQQVTDTCGMLESYCEVDKKLVKINKNTESFLMDENKAAIEGFGQTLASTLFYGDATVNPEKFTGLAPRYSVKSTNEDNVGYNILDAGGTGSVNTSIWLVVWGQDTVHGIYPQGSTAGLSMENLGEDTKTLSDGSMLQVLRTHYEWDCGLSVRNWRSVARVANIDFTELLTAGDTSDTSANILKYMNMAIDRVEEFIDGGKAAFYMHPEVRSMLREKMQSKGFAQLDMQTLMGRQNVLTCSGIPVRSCRALLKTESQIV